MTTRHVREAALPPGWRVERTSDKGLHHTQAGRLALPLSLHEGDSHCGDLLLIMTAEEAETLYAELGLLLYPKATEGQAS